MKQTEALVALLLPIAIISSVASGDFTQVRSGIDDVSLFCASNRWDYSAINDTVNFECLSGPAAYASFADTVSNDWREVLGHLTDVATNNLRGDKRTPVRPSAIQRAQFRLRLPDDRLLALVHGFRR